MTHEELKAKALSNPEVQAEYELLEAEFSLLKQMLSARENSGLSQEQIAERMGIKTSTLRQIESALVSGEKLPSLAKLSQYAQAIDCHIEVKLVHN